MEEKEKVSDFFNKLADFIVKEGLEKGVIAEDIFMCLEYTKLAFYDDIKKTKFKLGLIREAGRK
jgi:hypothetical protein